MIPEPAIRDPGDPKQILIVCTANICRSPLVAALLQDRIHKAGLEGKLHVESAGVRAIVGREVDPVVEGMLAEAGVGLADRYSTPVVEDALREAAIVLVMEEAHRQALFYRLPGALPKIFLLSELSGRNDEVSDPYGLDPVAYRDTYTLVAKLLDDGWPHLLQRLGIRTPPVT